jgi:phage replication initiation protein
VITIEQARPGQGMTFSPARPCKSRASGPSSNTGQKSTLAAPIIDFCTVVIPAESLKPAKCHLRELFSLVFGTGSRIAMGPLLDRSWNFFPKSATLVDEAGNVAGKVGVGEDGKVCFSLAGSGCAQVPNWHRVRENLEGLAAHLTRLDIAVDDLTGETFQVDYFKRAYESGAFVMNGRPPQSRFVDDMGSRKGCTLYIGQKGHKELCVYEKGKQLGDPDSDHTRCELRLYAKRLELPLDALSNPGKYFGEAYPLLVQFVIGECERLEVKERMVNASAVALKRFLKNQAGTGLHLVIDALGADAWEFIRQEIARPGRPGRFKGYTGDLNELLREQLNQGRDHHNGHHHDPHGTVQRHP